jgi:hypothetical protein
MGSPVLPQFSLCACRRHYPGGAAGCLSLSSPAVAAFPVKSPGQPPHHFFRGLLDVYSHYSPHTRGIAKRSFPSKASDGSLPPRLLRLLPAGATLAGRDLHPLKNCAFPRHTTSSPLPQGLGFRYTQVKPARSQRSSSLYSERWPFAYTIANVETRFGRR